MQDDDGEASPGVQLDDTHGTPVPWMTFYGSLRLGGDPDQDARTWLALNTWLDLDFGRHPGDVVVSIVKMGEGR